MKEQILLCIPTMTQYELCIKEIQSAELGTLKPDKYIIMDNGGGFTNFLINCNFTDFPQNKIEILNSGKNIGVASSWNYFLKNYEGILIICNDDIEFYPDSLEHLMNCYYSNKDISNVGMVTIRGINAHSHYGCFILTKVATDTVGFFDEEFYPAYYEDCDYDRRLTLSGVVTIFSETGTYNHIGSATYKAYTPEQLEAHHITFIKNRSYYESKWGGELYHETFNIPFNRG